MSTIVEPVQQSEQVLHFVRKEDMGTIAPVDTQCRAANLRGNRCKKEIHFDEEMNTWSQMCEKHHEQTVLARSNEARKVKKFE